MLSAHWEERPVTLGATRTVPLIYDFHGFAPHHYEQKYPAPGAPELAYELHSLASIARHLDALFARLYFRSYDAYEAGKLDDVPPAWRIAFDSARRGLTRTRPSADSCRSACRSGV